MASEKEEILKIKAEKNKSIFRSGWLNSLMAAKKKRTPSIQEILKNQTFFKIENLVSLIEIFSEDGSGEGEREELEES